MRVACTIFLGPPAGITTLARLETMLIPLCKLARCLTVVLSGTFLLVGHTFPALRSDFALVVFGWVGHAIPLGSYAAISTSNLKSILGRMV